MTEKEYRDYEDAADKVCLRCMFSGIDGENCEGCPVRKTIDKMNERREGK